MFAIKRTLKLSIICLCAVLPLSGCGDKAGGSSSRSGISAPRLVRSAETVQSAESSQTSAAESVQNPTVTENTAVYSNDPQNACTITFGSGSITVEAKNGDLTTGVEADYPPMNIEVSENNDKRTFVLTPKTNSFNKPYGSFFLTDANGYKGVVNLRLSENGTAFPDVSEIVEAGENALKDPPTLSEVETALYITLDGSRDKIPQILGDIRELSDEICAGISDDYEKLRAIVYWVAQNTYYDYPAHNNGMPRECLSLEYILNNRSSVCGGYSNLSSALCAAQGIRCYNIKGEALKGGGCLSQGLTGEYHEWNAAEVGGRTVIFDAGWNSLNTFKEDGTFNSAPMRFKYFDAGAEIFALDHRANSAEYRDYFTLLEE